MDLEELLEDLGDVGIITEAGIILKLPQKEGMGKLLQKIGIGLNPIPWEDFARETSSSLHDLKNSKFPRVSSKIIPESMTSTQSYGGMNIRSHSSYQPFQLRAWGDLVQINKLKEYCLEKFPNLECQEMSRGMIDFEKEEEKKRKAWSASIGSCGYIIMGVSSIASASFGIVGGSKNTSTGQFYTNCSPMSAPISNVVPCTAPGTKNTSPGSASYIPPTEEK